MKLARRPAVAVALGTLALLVSLTAFAQDRSFKDQDLARKDFRGQRLDGADSSGATLGNVDFTRASLRGANFQDADIRGTIFTGTDLIGADLHNSVGPFTAVNETNFSNANFEGLDINNTYLYASNVRGATALHSDEGMFVGAIYDDGANWPDRADTAKARAKRAL
ncbi:pentapeptide repeat-containing protein [Reyranella sp.]|uniref:pentapeptide repeat-containing protein n=1 Tax=Reyranella sp. TaxID=1929291 RepID=UPI002719A886|nr:pentapeptide repeat-containing protein [Reyranella sp.]MDO8974891.1 pentapeptide repeat-containing protein [Reyranella sp.]